MRNVVAALDFLETINMKQVSIDLDLYIKLNALLAIDQALETGHLRNQPVSIGCIPEDIEVFDKSLIEHEIKRIADITETDFREVIPDAFCRLARMQPFFDGNKRTTAFLCNVSLLKRGLGLFIINDEKLGRFNALLFEYYTGKNNDILEFIGNECIISVEQLAKEPSDAESDDECSSPSP
ncbi:MAG: Fic family protein [Desulfovibrio desulfuricans]|nr:Fic family protein [Desulfovibrio desulfuricans]